MSLSAGEIEAVLAELAPLAGARIDAVRVHAERALTLELHGRAGAALLLLSAEPDATRLHVVAARPSQPATPFGWQAVLRRELEGARLAGLERRGDRVVALRIERAGGPLALVAELTGRHGALLLLGPDGRIRAMAARGGGPDRPHAIGAPWIPPPPAGAPGAGAARLAPEGDGPFPLSAAIERAYLALEATRRLAGERRRLREPLRAALARGRRALERLALEAARVPAADEDRRRADLLKQNLHAIPRGARAVELTEWSAEGPRRVAVALDPALGPRENMERLYRRFRRIAESAARVEARAAEVRARVAALEVLVAGVDAAAAEGLPRLEREARRLGAAPRPPPPARRRDGDAAPLPHRAFRSLAGRPILVGRSAEGNGALTFRVASGNDLWLHVRGQTGAHVVVRLGRAAPDQETLLDAAHLAAHFSDARGAPQVDVAWTRVKHVRRQRGGAPGAVTYSQERVVALRLEPERLERLLAAEEGAEA